MIDNNICYENTISNVIKPLEYPLIVVKNKEPDIEEFKCILCIGNIEVSCTKKFNWFQRKMFKFLLGIEFKDLERGNYEQSNL